MREGLNTYERWLNAEMNTALFQPKILSEFLQVRLKSLLYELRSLQTTKSVYETILESRRAGIYYLRRFKQLNVIELFIVAWDTHQGVEVFKWLHRIKK